MLDVQEALRRATNYPQAVLSYVDDDGYPMSVAAPFQVDGDQIQVGPIDASLAGRIVARDGEVGVLFSHIRPQPGIGYDQRRYVNCWGRATPADFGPARRKEHDADNVVTLVVTVAQASGWDENETPFFEYAERNVATAHAYLGSVGQRPRLSRWWTFFLSTRLPFLTATIVPVALGGAVAARNHRFGWGWFLLALLAGSLVHLGLNIANDLFDDASGADTANVTPTPFSGGSRVMQHGLVSRRTLIRACVACYGAAVAIGLVLVATRGIGLLWIGAAGVFLSLAYTAPPFQLVHRGLGEPVTAAGFGPLMTLGAYYTCARGFSGEALYVSLPVALLIALVLYVNQIPDRVGDEAAGKRTLIVRWPKAAVIRGYSIAGHLAFGLIIAGVVLRETPTWTLLALLTYPMVRRVHRALIRSYERPYELMGAMQTNIGLHLFTGLLLVAGYVVHLALR